MNLGPNVWNLHPELDEQLKEMHGSHSFSQIALALGHGLSRNACIGRARRLDLGTYTPLRQRMPKPEKRQRSEPKPKPSAAEPEPMAEPLRIPMLELQSKHCRWPLWAHGETGFPLFEHCGLPKQCGSYCEVHAVACHGRENVRAMERAKDEAAKMEHESGLRRTFG